MFVFKAFGLDLLCFEIANYSYIYAHIAIAWEKKKPTASRA